MLRWQDVGPSLASVRTDHAISREWCDPPMHAREKFAAVPESISEDPSQPASWLAAGGEIGKKPSSGGRR